MGLKALDLFCGMGGLSWGLKSTRKIEPIWAVDNCQTALNLYELNLPKTNLLNLDLSRQLDVTSLIEKINFNGGIDLMVGGSPCQGFTQIRNGQDLTSNPNNNFAITFAKIVKALNPIAFIYENVPQIETYKVFKDFLAEFERDKKYKISYRVLEAVNFGNPSRRSRLFVVGFRSNLGRIPNIPTGLDISPRQFWLKRKEQDGNIFYLSGLSEPWYSLLLEPNNCQLVNVEQAISDLPVLTTKTIGITRSYASSPRSIYQKWSRQDIIETDGHVVPQMRPETRKRLKEIVEGGNWRDLPEALTYKIPYKLNSGKLRRNHYSAYRRLLSKGHSPTVQGHSDFAYHYAYERSLTPRELARLMSFTDDYKLGHQYYPVVKAIGNAVPPIVSKAVALSLVEQLE
ncbi:DNA cytosine methyltransferase [Lyngbya sp. PCC 8106]|uniref:DNA cytosine methyltransferase n=1 Tax=Lyngbya sp. (strain PCC 8106) TaxID=313612 RepID=UPI0000EA8F2D|nr:DNA cytosine methyltransferase [Lyngbya sp. PCC 8106]EAW35081.1 cytosine specific DNA methyltransferase (DDEM) [Lyngbya sp. PCC 8106]